MTKVAEVLALKKQCKRRLKLQKQQIDDKSPYSDVPHSDVSG